MQNYNGKYRKQPQKQKYTMTGIVGTVLVLSLFAIAFYKLGERSARESQEPVSETAALIQETYTEPPSTTEATTVVTTEATTAPIETTAAPLSRKHNQLWHLPSLQHKRELSFTPSMC